MSALGNYAERALLDEIFNTAQSGLTPVTSTKIGLHTADPGEDGLVGEVSTTVWTNYARELVNNDGGTSPYWNAGVISGVGYVTDNNGVVDFGTATMSPTTSVLAISHLTVWDQANNLLYYGALDITKNVEHQDPVQFASGSIDLSMR